MCPYKVMRTASERAEQSALSFMSVRRIFSSPIPPAAISSRPSSAVSNARVFMLIHLKEAT
jgi:hypothetical protein